MIEKTRKPQLKLTIRTVIAVFILIVPVYYLNAQKLPSTQFRKMSLSNAVNLALINDHELRKLKFDSKAFHDEDIQTSIDYLPKITSEITTRNNTNIVSNPRGTTIFSSYSTITVPVYNRSLIYNKRKSRTQIILNRLNMINRMNDVCKEIITLYYSVLNLKAIVKIRKEEYDKANQTYKLTGKKLKYDKAIPLDVLLIRGLVLKSKNDWIDAKNEYHQERYRLIDKLNLKDDIELTTPKEKWLKTMSLQLALSIAMRERTDIQAKYYDLKIKKQLYEIERSLLYPKVELFSDIRYDERSGTSNQLEWSVFVMVSMSLLDDLTMESKAGTRKYSYLDKPIDEESLKLSLNDGSSNRIDKSKARSSYLSLKEDVRALGIQIKQDIVDAFYQLIKAKNNIKLARLNVKIGQGLLKKIQAENRLGRKAMEDLIEAIKNNVQYQVEYQRANLNFHLAVLNLKWAMGILWKDFLSNILSQS